MNWLNEQAEITRQNVKEDLERTVHKHIFKQNARMPGKLFTAIPTQSVLGL